MEFHEREKFLVTRCHSTYVKDVSRSTEESFYSVERDKIKSERHRDKFIYIGKLTLKS